MTETNESSPKPQSELSVEKAEEFGKIEPKVGADFADKVMPGVDEEITRLEKENPNDPRVKAYYQSFKKAGLNTPEAILKAANPAHPKVRETLDKILGIKSTEDKVEKSTE